MISLTHCSGKKMTAVGQWYKFPNIAASADTRCAYCASYLAARGVSLDAIAAGATCNCDSHKDQSIFGLNCEGMRFEVWSKDCSYPLLNVYSNAVLPVRPNLVSAGNAVEATYTLVVYSDENEFCIVARNNNEEPRTNNIFDKLINVMAPEKKDIYFTFENANARQKPVYHHNKTTYEGSIAEHRSGTITMVCKIYNRIRRGPAKVTYYSDIASAKNDIGRCASLDELQRKYSQLLGCVEVHPDGSVRLCGTNGDAQRDSYDTIDDFIFMRKFSVQFQFMRGGIPARPKLRRQTVDTGIGQWPNINFETFNFEKPRVKCRCGNVSENTGPYETICEGCESEEVFREQDDARTAVNVSSFNEIISLLNSKAGSPLTPVQMRVIRRALNGETQIPQNIFTSLGQAESKEDKDYELFLRVKSHPNYNFDKIMAFLDADNPVVIEPKAESPRGTNSEQIITLDRGNAIEDEDYALIDDQ